MTGQWLPVTMHEDQGGVYKDRSTTNLPLWRLVQPSNLTVWAFNDRFFASLRNCMLPRALSKYWQKETAKSKVFLWGDRFGRSLLCQGWAEKKTSGSRPMHSRVLTCRQKQTLSRFVAWRERSLMPDTHTHARAIKAPWTARSSALARTWPLTRIIF